MTEILIAIAIWLFVFALPSFFMLRVGNANQSTTMIAGLMLVLCPPVGYLIAFSAGISKRKPRIVARPPVRVVAAPPARRVG